MTLDSLHHFDTPAGLAWANAIESDDRARLHALAARGGINDASGSGTTPLAWALHTQRPAAFGELLRLGAHPSPETIEAALLRPAPDYAHMLITAGFDLNGCSPLGDPWVFTPLLARNRPCYRLLFEKGASLDSRRRDGTTALVALITLGEFEDAFWLLERGADPGLPTSTGATAARRTAEARAVREDQLVWRRRTADTLRFRGFSA